MVDCAQCHNVLLQAKRNLNLGGETWRLYWYKANSTNFYRQSHCNKAIKTISEFLSKIRCPSTHQRLQYTWATCCAPSCTKTTSPSNQVRFPCLLLSPLPLLPSPLPWSPPPCETLHPTTDISSETSLICNKLILMPCNVLLSVNQRLTGQWQ